MKTRLYRIILGVVFLALPFSSSAATLQDTQKIQLIAEIKQKIITLQIQLLELQLQELLNPDLRPEEAAAKALPSSVSIISSAPVFSDSRLEIFQEMSSGSGFIVTQDGYVITNSHVVANINNAFKVVLADGAEYPGIAIYRDTIQDIALIKIETPRALAAATLGNSDELKTGQQVVTIGNAFGTNPNTLSTGSIVALNQDIVAQNNQGESELLNDTIQSNAQIHPGNSGGPLIDLQGRVVGVNVAMAASQSFSIPINTVKEILKKVGVINESAN